MQGYQVTCPRCGRASNVLHTHQHVQQALTTTHISPSTGAPCAYLQSQSGQLLSTGPCFKGSLPSTAGLLHGQHVDAPQLTSRQHDDPIPVEPQAVRLMGLILAQIALDVAATSQAASQGKPLAGKAQDTGIEASLRAWAIRVLTQVRSSCLQDLHVDRMHDVLSAMLPDAAALPAPGHVRKTRLSWHPLSAGPESHRVRQLCAAEL